VVTPTERRAVITFWKNDLGMSERWACALMGIARSSVRYRPAPDRNVTVRARLRELAEERRRFGYRRLHVLLHRESFRINHKRVQRLYRQEGLRCV